jgi:hypothetical protein
LLDGSVQRGVLPQNELTQHRHDRADAAQPPGEGGANNSCWAPGASVHSANAVISPAVNRARPTACRRAWHCVIDGHHSLTIRMWVLAAIVPTVLDGFLAVSLALRSAVPWPRRPRVMASWQRSCRGREQSPPGPRRRAP